MDVEVTLETAYVEMPVSTQDFTEIQIQGWVEMLNKPPGETVEVELSVSNLGQYNIGVFTQPNIFYFFYEETRYFNLSLRFQEDTPPGFEYLVDVDAMADSLIGSDLDTFHLTVNTVPELSGEASMLEQPPDARPGEVTTGVVQVTNLGTKYAEYRMSISQDPTAAVESVKFNLEVEMTPHWVEKVPFDVAIAESTPPGSYEIILNLLVLHEDGSTAIVDTFTVEVQVVEPEETYNWGATFMIAVIFVSIVAVIALAIRRRK
ncbi:MAG: hypothetical protein LN414_04320 [Candidatus Thermoplasmatota archaeon]|nr:hypothetical protein [Candidatus Thermoplasmatota archaeon]